ncbi:pyruvate kinase [Alicyclobacillus cycloheptanicus]|uniref:Pyruvate kinase n=1 Tax=Alicyclobacillus cycloheptanicus TaxID=1457 RepID=A0ABT9XLF0_9BACL|nr:pyruvate kinase [Alicyclobacillus cycloheptanicus]MDQ0191140.1 pyruvate kinase [Alicyclobacillus cycloheptanicus]WDM01881.1 pyruvate kinase [Alicyclobacillus cycloheptanicus]
MRRTKIVCTIGPASETPEVLRQLIEAGLDVARLNFSHGTYDEHAARIRAIREAAAAVGKHVGIMLDIKGPKIRTGKIEGGEAILEDGAHIILTTEPLEYGTAERVSISYEGLVEDVYPGAPIRIDDGLIGLEVEEVRGQDIHCRVTNGGVLKDRKGINVPGVTLRIPGVTEKDEADIRFGIEQGVDFIAASFVRKAADVLEVRRILEEGGYHADIIAKIETQEGLNRLEEILEVADGMMVARGDLGVEIATEEVPLAQKRMISLCNQAGKPVITATQMLDSMQRNPRPTRAEASDVANAIFDGTDAIMLSGETAAGRYPVESVKMMAQIAERAERALLTAEVPGRHGTVVEKTVTDVIGHAVQTMAADLGVSAILTATTSGHTARMIAKHRPSTFVVAATPLPEVARRLTVSWGVYPVIVPQARTTDEVLETTVSGALDAGYVKHGDLVFIVAGVPVGQRGTTNLIKVHTIGDVLARGTGIGQAAVSGRAVVAIATDDILARVQAGDILVTVGTDKDVVPAMERAAGIVVEEGGLTSHTAVVGLTLGKPVIVGVADACKVIADGSIITVDPQRGLVYRGRAQVL